MPIDPEHRPLQQATDEILDVVLTVVRALKQQPGFDQQAFEAVIQERIDRHNLSKAAFAALALMIEDFWGAQENNRIPD